jgi:hypothetical protein
MAVEEIAVLPVCQKCGEPWGNPVIFQSPYVAVSEVSLPASKDGEEDPITRVYVCARCLGLKR